MSDRVSPWEELLDQLRYERTQDEIAGRGSGAFAAEWLATRDELSLSLPREHDTQAFEPYLSLLRIFGRLNRGLSELLYRRSYLEQAPLLGSDFGDWAVGSLAREAYLDLRLAGSAFYNGLDLQAMCLLRQMAELAWRALIVAGDPSVADEWWASIVASAESGERDKLEKGLWQRHFRPAALLRHVTDIEARIDGLEGGAAEAQKREVIGRKAAIYSMLSGTAHGGTELVYASVVRGTGPKLPEDPFTSLGTPTDLGRELVSGALYLQARFWRYFPRAAFPEVAAEPVSPETPEGALVLVAHAVERFVERRYASYVE